MVSSAKVRHEKTATSHTQWSPHQDESRSQPKKKEKISTGEYLYMYLREGAKRGYTTFGLI